MPEELELLDDELELVLEEDDELELLDVELELELDDVELLVDEELLEELVPPQPANAMDANASTNQRGFKIRFIDVIGVSRIFAERIII